MLRNFLVIALISLITACGSSSHLLIGEKRSSIPITEVKIYTSEPKAYDAIAIIDASSKNSLVFTGQQKMDAALI